MPLSETIFHKSIFLWNNLWLILLPLSAVMAWQDLKLLRVNRNLAYLTCAVFTLGFAEASNESIIVCLVSLITLLIYKKFRPTSIQRIDIEFFSLGILWVNQEMISYYCFAIALALLLFKLILKQRKLPFLTAWFIGVWIAFYLS
jgi:hypothetical protein